MADLNGRTSSPNAVRAKNRIKKELLSALVDALDERMTDKEIMVDAFDILSGTVNLANLLLKGIEDDQFQIVLLAMYISCEMDKEGRTEVK